MGGAMSKRVERAEKTGVIALRDEGLTELPAKLFQIKSLRVCDLTNNKLKKLPAPLGRLSMLPDRTTTPNNTPTSSSH
tara:strand:+ start:213 stop:446 length:234 start_codon:yes stop_codon:yes gene_type:complete